MKIIKLKYLQKISVLVYYFSILIFVIALNFEHNPPSGWYQQFLPDLNGASIVDITFTDSLSGYAVTNVNTSSVSYIMKTSNGGDNWNFILADTGRNFSRIQFINNTTGYASTLYGTETSKLFKTTDGGNNWIRLFSPGMFNEFRDISVVSENEIWMTDINVFSGGVFRSTNSGINWELKYPPGFSGNPDRICMINSRIGFISNGNISSSYIKKTTNSGDNWFDLSAQGGWDDIYFRDSLVGWKCRISINNIIKTTDGGNNWFNILNAQTGNPNLIVQKFEIINDSLIWGVYIGSYFIFPNNSGRAVIFKSSNNGFTWGYQIPDTSFRITGFKTIDFVDTKIGWSHKVSTTGVHTVTGGDTVTYPITSISSSSTIIPDKIKLYQNYPNPFNPVTKISYELRSAAGGTSDVELKVFDVLGKEVSTLVNEKQNAGSYEVEFDGSEYPSGVYFYSLIVDGRMVDTKRMMLIK